ALRLIAVDANGNWLPDNIPSDKVEWKHWIPTYAKVQATLRGEVDAAGNLVTEDAASVGAFKATWNGIEGTTRGRVVGTLPLKEDFETFTFAPDPNELGQPF